MPRTKTVPQICEICFVRKASSLTIDKEINKWFFTCDKCLPYDYWIEFSRINELDWYDHIEKKRWMDMESFAPRFRWIQHYLKKLQKNS